MMQVNYLAYRLRLVKQNVAFKYQMQLPQKITILKSIPHYLISIRNSIINFMNKPRNQNTYQSFLTMSWKSNNNIGWMHLLVTLTSMTLLCNGIDMRKAYSVCLLRPFWQICQMAGWGYTQTIWYVPDRMREQYSTTIYHLWSTIHSLFWI